MLSQSEWDRGLRLGRAWRPLHFDINRLAVKMKPGALARHPEPAEKLVAVAGRVNATALEFLVARDDIVSLARHLEPNLARSNPEDAALAPLLDWLTRAANPATEDFVGRQARLAVSFESSKAADTNEAPVFMSMVVDPLRFIVGIRRVTDAAIDDALMNWPLDRHAYPNAEVTVRISCGYANLTDAELHSMQVGDVIVADNSPGDVDSRFLLAGDTVYLWNRNLRHLEKIPFNNAARRAMSDDYDGFDQDEDFALEAGPEEATTKVVFLAGVATVPIATLQSADVGYIFKTDREAGMVDILVGGKKIGVGQLVQAESGVGVRITRLIES